MAETRLGKFFTRKLFSRLAAEYGAKHGAGLALVDGEGGVVRGGFPAGAAALLPPAAREAARWGEPQFVLLPGGGMAWLAPVMLNGELLGAAAAFTRDENPLETADVRAAAADLLAWLAAENLTNAAHMELRREKLLRERRRAEAIHEYKRSASDFRFLYLREEPGLMAAIRRGSREEARGILNKILVVLLHQAGGNLNLVKSFLLEIITMMGRTAVEAGCDAREVFGGKYGDFAELSRIEADDELSPWLHEMLERLQDAIRRNRNNSSAPGVQAALDFMRANMAEGISRDDAAAAAHMSPSHFSRLFKKMLGENFSEHLARMRVERAAELLTRSALCLSAIALDCGFKDQSYFTKVFRKYFDRTPGGYRRLSAARSARGRRARR